MKFWCAWGRRTWGPYWKAVVWLAAALFVVQACGSIWLARWHHPGFDFAFEAGAIAKSLATSGQYSSPLDRGTGPTAWLSPLYPFLLSLIFRIFGVYTTASAFAALALNSAFSAVTCLALAALVWLVSQGKVAAVCAAGLVALSPSTAFLTLQIWDTALTGCLLCSFLYLATLAARAPSRRLIVCVSMAGGLLFLSNAGAGTLFVPAALLLLSLRIPRRLSVGAMAGFVLMATPWMVRNYVLFGRLEPRCCPGFELKMGNNRATWETGSTTYLPSQTLAANPKDFAAYARDGEAASDRASMRDALAFIRADYWRFAYMTARRIRDFWFGSFSWTLGTGGTYGVSPFLMDLLYFLALGSIPILSLLGMYGLVRALARNYLVGLLVLFLAVYPPILYVNSVNLRLQYPAQLVLMALGSMVLVRRQHAVDPVTGRRAERRYGEPGFSGYRG